ncbi:unnamed protein product [Lepeophtheirus salmonis]|uniref:(salmon louse) hypothetical protein n=1 Tax=Lepeophtheirus salmonis TaxID=72036 RepID=A0A7R8H6Y2_LEPSM|nr:unnamed protein product [Lepeophtheirus salmonis]CAF2897660.1 unnamed protein product [Lepeophtheirus salmonis]
MNKPSSSQEARLRVISKLLLRRKVVPRSESFIIQIPFRSQKSNGKGNPQHILDLKRINTQNMKQFLKMKFLLPPNIPGTFELERGKIFYQIYAKVNIPYSIFDPNTTRPFVVIKQNLILPAACNPLQGSIQEQVGMCCFSKGDVSAIVGLQRSGFVPGEDLHFSLHIENESSKEISRSLVELCQYTYYFGIRRTNNRTYKRDQFNKRKQAVIGPAHKDLETKKVWTELEFPSVKPGDTFTCADSALKLNSKLLLSNLFDCSTLMKTHYTLEVTLVLGCLYSNKTTTIPIEIGSSYTSGAPIYNEPNIFIPAQTGPAVPLLQAPYPYQPPTYPSGGPFPNYPSQFESQGPIMEAPQIHQPPSAPFFSPNIPTAPNLEFSPPPPYNPLPEQQKLP